MKSGRIVTFLLALAGTAEAATLKDVTLPQTVAETLAKGRDSTKTPYDVKQWIAAVENNNSRDAAHLWGHVETKIPQGIKQEAHVAYLVQLAKLDLPQTFTDQLVENLSRKNFATSKAWRAFEPTLQPIMAEALAQEAIDFSPDQKLLVKLLPSKGVGLDLKAWARLREPSANVKMLDALPDSNLLRPYFVSTRVAQLARSGEVKGAIKLLEEELKVVPNDEGRSIYNLHLGRLYFQNAALDQAEVAYSAVSPQSGSIDEAREELLWVWLRKGDHSRLRGAVASMQLGRYDNAFFPELFVVRAISNLKLCHYEAAKEDFGNFITYNEKWAKKIEDGLKSSTPAQPPSPDMFTRLIETAEVKRQAEAAILKKVREDSIAAAVPAIGVQRHWKEAEKRIEGRLNRLRDAKFAEYKRIWRNDSVMLQEAIRKMKFVKVELLSQTAQGRESKPDSESAKKSSEEAVSKVEDAGKGRWVFPFDGVAWPDEVFAARSTANNICL